VADEPDDDVERPGGADDVRDVPSDDLWADFDATAADDDTDLEADPAAGEPASDIALATADLDDDTDGSAELSSLSDRPAATGPTTLAEVEVLLDQRWPETKIEPSLHRITALLDLLGNPQQAYPVILVAGTNGKTSTARMIDALLGRIGVRTGRFTSPHLQSVTERICLDGEPISELDYVQAYLDVAPYIELVDSGAGSRGVRLSKFEILTAMAYAAFANAPIEVGVIEVGLGGTWDSTNVVDPQVAVITPIGIDHADYLGDTIAEIAGEKAGIIKPDCIVVIGAQDADAMKVLLRRAVEVDATVARFGSEFAVTSRRVAVGGQRLTLQGLGGVYDDVFLPLHGAHQAENAALALAAVEAFFGAGRERQLDVVGVQDGFAAVASPGRLERVGTNPTVLVDAAHNPHGAAALARAIADEFAFSHLVGVLAVMADKDVDGILTALADTFDEVVVTANSSPRSMPAADLATLAEGVFGTERVHRAETAAEALALARDLAAGHGGTDDDMVGPGVGVLATGSVVTAGDIRELAGRPPQ
jgi:dihydrofolate synthase / folylpolyglutamate synthase